MERHIVSKQCEQECVFSCFLSPLSLFPISKVAKNYLKDVICACSLQNLPTQFQDGL